MTPSMIGEEIIQLESVGSTNKHAAELLERSKIGHGTVILAEEQTDGRGQRGRSWSSTPGSDLTFSVILHTTGFIASEQFGIAQAAALAVCDALEQEDVRHVRVKWPNDVLIENRKVAGILIRNEVVGGMLEHAIVGVGLNVNSAANTHEQPSTSVRMEIGREIDRTALLNRLLEAFQKHWEALRTDRNALSAMYKEALWGRGRWLPMELDGVAVEGRMLDVDELGRAIVELPGGAVKTLGMDRLRFGPR